MTIRTVLNFTYSPRGLYIVLFSTRRAGINAKQSDGMYVPYYLDIAMYIERENDIKIWRGASWTAAGMYAVPSLYSL